MDAHGDGSASAVERNLGLYPHYQTARNLLLWLPIFFLYFSQHLSIDAVLLLEAIYYAAVVILEVPSGYLSDRIGRRPTLVIANVCWVVACIVFATTGSMTAFAAAQVLLAAGMAFNSGSDGSLLYDSLAALGRAGEFAEREGRAQARARIALGIGALLGGAVAAIDLRLAYVGSAIAAAIAAAIAWSFVEPPDRDAALPVGRQLVEVGARLREPILAWTFAVAVAMTVFHHVPYELAQPYVFVVMSGHGLAQWTEPVSGTLAAFAMLLGAIASMFAGRLARGDVRRTLLAVFALQGLVIAAMGWWTSTIVLFVIALRAVAAAVENPLVQAVAHPRLRSGLRATYLSVQSLAGRLAFATSLAIASATVGVGATISPDVLAPLARGFAIALFLVLALFTATARLARPRPPGPA